MKVAIPGGQTYQKLKKQLRSTHLHTICEEAKCPNLAECFQQGTATYLILGEVCTRNCRYCHVTHGKPEPLNPDEAEDVAESVKNLGLNHVVITSVTRDDLDDGGASIFRQTIHAIRKKNAQCTIEVLIPDFQGKWDAMKTVLNAEPDVLNHNMEVVYDLFPSIRPEGDYHQSLEVLAFSKQYKPKMITKSGFMVGLGETPQQINRLIHDLYDVGVDILTIGQYLQPSKNHETIKKYYTPDEFTQLSMYAKQVGFSHVEAGPLVRSSYHAEEAMKKAQRIAETDVFNTIS